MRRKVKHRPAYAAEATFYLSANFIVCSTIQFRFVCDAYAMQSHMYRYLVESTHGDDHQTQSEYWDTFGLAVGGNLHYTLNCTAPPRSQIRLMVLTGTQRAVAVASALSLKPLSCNPVLCHPGIVLWLSQGPTGEEPAPKNPSVLPAYCTYLEACVVGALGGIC